MEVEATSGRKKSAVLSEQHLAESLDLIQNTIY
jgi:hypothetical protein